MSARPEGFDYTKPDPECIRCRQCNPLGMNRTGLIPVGHVGASTEVLWAQPCPAGCHKGLIHTFVMGEGI